MAHESFLRILQCPYCGGELELEGRRPAQGADVDFGTLRCRCYRYGIVLGIVVLRQASPPNDNRDPIVAALDEGDHEGAVAILLANETASKAGRRVTFARMADRLKGRRRRGAVEPFPASETLRAALKRWRPDYYGEYLEYRYANPSLLAAVPVIAAMAKALALGDGAAVPWAIDIGCGVGHTTHLLKSLLPSVRMVAADSDFLNLALAKRYVSPDGSFICFDAEAGLPFREGVFDAAFSLDCVHYIRGKHKLAAELRRIGRPDALYALCHLHNVERANPNQGVPLSGDGYSEVFGRLGGRLYAEPTLLESFSDGGSLALGLAADAASMDVANAFTYLSLGDGAAGSASTRLDRYMASSLSCFSLNRLYDRVRAEGAFELRLRWPSEKLRGECCAGVEPLKDKVTLARAVMDAVLGRRFDEVPAETFEALIRSFVVVPQPGELGARP